MALCSANHLLPLIYVKWLFNPFVFHFKIHICNSEMLILFIYLFLFYCYYYCNCGTPYLSKVPSVHVSILFLILLFYPHSADQTFVPAPLLWLFVSSVMGMCCGLFPCGCNVTLISFKHVAWCMCVSMTLVLL